MKLTEVLGSVYTVEWTTGMMEYWNGILKVQYQFLHPNKCNSSP